MKKKWLAVLLTIAITVSMTACGQKEESAQAPAAESEAQADPAEETAAPQEDTQTPEAQANDTSRAASETDRTQTEENAAADETPASDSQAFAQSIKDAVAAQDLEALSALFTFPSYVADYEDPESGNTVETKEDLIAIGADRIFTEDLLASIEAVDSASVTEVKAGYVMMGSDKAAIIFNGAQDGSFGITGLSY